MTESSQNEALKLKRTLDEELIRLENDFDDTRLARKKIVNHINSQIENIKLTDSEGNVKEETDVAIRLVALALKALSDTERANAQAVTVKIKRKEADTAAAAVAKERLEAVLRAARAGNLEDADFDQDEMEQKLSEMFDDQIKDFELKTSHRDLSD